MKIIDMHTHNVFADLEKLIESASHNNISKCVFLGDVLKFGYYPNEEQIHEINNGTIECVEKYPDLCFGFCFLNPANNLDFCLEEIERCVKGHGFKGIKLEVSLNCRNAKLRPIMEKLQELDIPLLHHSWYKSGGNLPEESTPADIAYLGSEFPDLKIIMAHLAGCGIMGILDIMPFKNIHIDTSGGQSHSGLIEFAIKKLGPERILFGSDAPYRDFSSQHGRIEGANASSNTKEMIFHKNAERLLKI
jgi:predicted TIM-barrel fold metal-dependent hydrolase